MNRSTENFREICPFPVLVLKVLENIVIKMRIWRAAETAQQLRLFAAFAKDLSPQHPHGGLHPSITPSPRNPTHVLTSVGTKHLV